MNSPSENGVESSDEESQRDDNVGGIDTTDVQLKNKKVRGQHEREEQKSGNSKTRWQSLSERKGRGKKNFATHNIHGVHEGSNSEGEETKGSGVRELREEGEKRRSVRVVECLTVVFFSKEGAERADSPSCGKRGIQAGSYRRGGHLGKEE